MKKWCLALLLLMKSVGSAEAPGSLTFPAEVHLIENETEVALHLVGTATRSKFFLNLYTLGFYLHYPTKTKRDTVWKEMLKDGQIKQFTIKWLYGSDLKTLKKGLYAGFHKMLSPQEYREIASLIDTYIAFYTEGTKKGDEHILRWVPGNSITLEIKGEFKGKITNPIFAKSVWRIWYDSKSIVDGYGLVKNILD